MIRALRTEHPEWPLRLLGRVLGVPRSSYYYVSQPEDDLELGFSSARRASTCLWVTVKGYYEGDNRSIAGNWARHSFEAAMLDVILWREDDQEAMIVVALPRLQTYENLLARVGWFRRVAAFSVIWVDEQGASWESTSRAV